MPDQDSIEARKAASARGAADNADVGVDGDDPSEADAEGDHVDTPTDTSDDGR